MPDHEEILTTRHIVVKQATYTAPFAVGPYRGGLAHRDNGKFPSAPTSIVNFGALIFYLVVRRYSRDSLKTFVFFIKNWFRCLNIQSLIYGFCKVGLGVPFWSNLERSQSHVKTPFWADGGGGEEAEREGVSEKKIFGAPLWRFSW